MREIIVAKNVGFCKGVERSIAMVYSALKRNNGRVFTDGPIVHNADVVSELARLGARQISDDVNLNENDTAIIRAHGIAKKRKEFLAAQKCTLLDATCPKILRIIGLLKKYSAQGYFTILIGEHEHPEVVGICSYAEAGKIIVFSNEKDFLSWEGVDDPILVLSQTTCNVGLFSKISERIKSKFPGACVINTICSATQKRQKEIKALLEKGCDSIVVLGGKFSKNTNELARTAILGGCTVQIWENANHLDTQFVNNSKILGLTSGTSTDTATVEEVRRRLYRLLISK